SGKLTKHFWDEFYFNAYMPVINSEYGLLMPENVEFNAQSRNGAPQPIRKPTDDGILYTWKVNNEQPIVFEAGMPGRIEVGKMLRISTIPSWEFMVDWYRELAQTKTQSSYEIKELIQQLIPNPDKVSDEEKIQIVFRYITENIRYSSISFRQSGLVPQKARDVLVDKIGDCKDVSTLGIALLREVGIKAHYVLVNSGSEDRIGDIPPSIEFNHCIAAVERNNEYYFLDFTAFNHPAGAMPGMDRSAFSLIIKEGETKPILLPRSQMYTAPTLTVRSVVSLSQDLKADFMEQVTLTGTATANLRFQYRGKPAKEREKSLQSSLSVEYPNVKLTALQMSDLEQLTPKETYTYAYTIPNFLTEAGSYRLLKMPWQNALSPDNSMSYEARHYPIRSISPVDTV
ncbi:MAG TPA: transglutaminase domain-containing protein, partial [Candidatus Kapabacteria bacterium]|nr:transglutaminase domain-containing protein [Candidatus Kapabacteria bacterium]